MSLIGTLKRSVTPVVDSVESESDGVRAHRLAGETDSVAAKVVVLLAQARSLSLNVAKTDQQLGFARTNLAKARQMIQRREMRDACAWAQTALNQASLAREWVEGLMAKHHSLTTLCRGLEKKLSELCPQVSVASVLGQSVRTGLAPAKQPPQEWRALRWLDQVIALRVKEVEILLGELRAQLGRGELDGIEWDAERAKAWIDQTNGYINVLTVLEGFLSTPSEQLADKATMAYTLMSSIHLVFREHVSPVLMRCIDDAYHARALIKGPEDIKAHDELLIKSLAAVLVIENNLLEIAAQRFGQRQARNERDLTGWTAALFGGRVYYDLALADHARMLVDLFPPRLSASERSRSEESYHGDGSPCTC